MKKLIIASILSASMLTGVAFADKNMGGNNGGNNSAAQLLTFISKFQGNNGFGGLNARSVNIDLDKNGNFTKAVVILTGPITGPDKNKIYMGLQDAQDFVGNNGIGGASVTGGPDAPVLAIKDMTSGPNAETYAISVSYKGNEIDFTPAKR